MYKVKNPGSIIRERRLQAGLTQKELSEEVRVSESYLSRLERSQVGLGDPSVAERIERTLDIEHGLLWNSFKSERVSLQELKRTLPHFLLIIQYLVQTMSAFEQIETIGMFEGRIIAFDEDPRTLADNLRRVLIGELEPDEDPENGTRPLSHYWKPLTAANQLWPLVK